MVTWSMYTTMAQQNSDIPWALPLAHFEVPETKSVAGRKGIGDRKPQHENTDRDDPSRLSCHDADLEGPWSDPSPASEMWRQHVHRARRMTALGVNLRRLKPTIC